MSFEYFDAAGTAVAEGVFIPIAAVPGLVASELASGQAAGTKLGKSVFALINQIYNTLSPTNFNKLGFTVSKGNPAGVGADIINQNFGFTAQKLLNLKTDAISMIPEPTSGANSGLGSFSLSDVFAGAVKVAAAGAVSGAGVLIPTALLATYSSITQGGITISGSSDNRDWFAALFDWLGNGLAVRDASTASAVIARSASAISAVAIPANFTQTTDPVSGILAADLPVRGLISKSYSVTVQLQLNQTTQTFDVLSTTA